MNFKNFVTTGSFLFFAAKASALTISTPTPGLQAPSATLIEEALQILPLKMKAVLPPDLQFKLKSGTTHTGQWIDGKTVQLNEALIQDYMQNPKKENFVRFTRHPDFHTYLVATIVHELSHAYDFSGQNMLEYKTGKQLMQNCNYDPDSPEDKAKTFDPDCYVLSQKKGRISGDPEFLNLTYEYFNGSQRTSRLRGNFFENRSVDPYEFKNSAEAFATHMEFFLLDPEFKCRKPALYRYFSERLAHVPFANATCSKFAKQFYLSPTMTDFRPQMRAPKGLLYQIHYFMAGPGEGVVSRFGHAMLRLVYCSPERTVASEDCLFDVEHHIVISPAAGITDFDYSTYDGMSGKYPTFLFASGLSSRMIDYNKIEEREIFSIPLKLNDRQLKSLETTILEAHWNYKNKYYFLSNNCAVEVLNLLKRSLPENYALQTVMEIKPTNLLESLHAIGLVSSHNLDEWRRDDKKRFYFPSITTTLNKLEQLLGRSLGSTGGISYRKLSWTERKAIIAKILELNPETKRRLAAATSYLEENIQLKLSLALAKKVSAEIAAGKQKGPSEAVEIYKKEYSVWMAPPQLLSAKEYGLPTTQELDQVVSQNQAMFDGSKESQKNMASFSKTAAERYPEARDLDSSRQLSMLLKGAANGF